MCDLSEVRYAWLCFCIQIQCAKREAQYQQFASKASQPASQASVAGMCLWTAVAIIERTTHIGPATGSHSLSRHHAATPGARGTSRVDPEEGGHTALSGFRRSG